VTECLFPGNRSKLQLKLYLEIVSQLALVIPTALAVNAVWSLACFIRGLRQAGKFDPNHQQAENQR
jgi:hypothetical protein